MSSFVSYLISGISLGSVYAIIALGYTMVYGIAKMLNFAHGDVIMVGSYVVYVAVSGMGLNPILAILLSIIICTLMGVVIEGVAYRPLRNAASPLAVLITAIGVSYLLQNLKTRNPKSLKLCTLLDKPDRRVCDVKVDYVGFEIPDEFVVGFGLDLDQQYRNLPYIGCVELEDEE